MNSPNRLAQIETLFHAALEHESAARAAFLAQACVDDRGLLDAVNALLAAHEQAGGQLDQRHAALEFDSTSDPTRHLPAAPAPQPVRSTAPHSSGDGHREGRFVTGAMLAQRYRIVGLLGRGGMGEVYKAEDLKLNQTVALKFLPESIALDGAMLTRFHNEVRIARQVAHPNVCRVYDIGEVQSEFGGLHFLSMEFIDGEDLSGLLRRIGRLPGDKAVELARQMCAGLAAAHEAGVLHRDLKPANVMIDGRGKARITDFGLAVVAEELRGEEVLAGTPAYMAPEQLTGKEATQRSDIYALGLVLYELFTGKRVFEAQSLQELIALHEKSAPSSPSSHVKDIDPLVERVILRCLAKDPKARPASAVQVALALPGGDPLQAALAMGDTPSPEMVAAAPLEGTLRPAVAVTCLAAVLVGLALIVLLAGKERMKTFGPLEKSPDVLTERARNIVQRLGYTDPPTDSASGFSQNADYVQYVREHEASPTRWEKLKIGQPAAVYFWYRQSPGYLVPTRPMRLNFPPLSLTDPPMLVSGMANVTLDPQGRLLAFQVVPPRMDEPSGAAHAPDWAALFAEAGLEMANFKPTASRWVPPMNNDSRAAWEGVWPQQPQIPLRIEAAAYRGRAVWFEMISPWAEPALKTPVRRVLAGNPIGLLFFLVFFLVMLLGGVLLARRNLRLGRGDRQGALRLALFVLSLQLLFRVLRANHVPAVEEFELFWINLPLALFGSGVVWLVYLALEPYVRRRWPHRIIGWSRVLAGKLRDPLVGRDLLLGGLFAIGTWLLISLMLKWPGITGVQPRLAEVVTLQGLRGLFSVGFSSLAVVVSSALGYLFVLMLLSILLRKEWLAFGVVWIFLTVIESGVPGVGWITAGLVAAICFVVLARFGLLAGVAYGVCYQMIRDYPITSDFSAWYGGGTLFALGVMVAMCGYGFYTSLGGQKVFAGKLLDE